MLKKNFLSYFPRATYFMSFTGFFNSLNFITGGRGFCGIFNSLNFITGGRGFCTFLQNIYSIWILF